jgi:MFS family permease
MSPAELAQRARQHPLILPIYVPSILVAITWGIREPILPLYIRDFGATYGLVGLVLSGEAIGMLATDLPSGMVVRWLGQRRTMIVGLVLTMLAALALFWARSIPELMLYRILGGVGFSLYGVARHAYLAEQITVGQRGRAVALLGGVFRIGRFAGPTIGGFVATAFTLRAPFLVMAGLTGVALLVVILFLPASPARQEADFQNFRAYLGRLRAAAGENGRVLLPVGAGQMLAQMVRTGPAILFPLYGADVLGLDVAAIGAVLSTGAAVDMTLFYPTGVIMDRFGRKFAIIPSFLLQGLGLALIPLTQSFAGLAFVAGLVGLGNGLGSGTMLTLGADLAPPDSRGEFLGIWRLIGDTGGTVGPIIGGAIAGWLALPIAAVVMGSSGLLSSLIFATLVPETNRRVESSER